MKRVTIILFGLCHFGCGVMVGLGAQRSNWRLIVLGFLLMILTWLVFGAIVPAAKVFIEAVIEKRKRCRH